MRWYELDSTVYMALSMIELQSLTKQFECARLILEEISKKNDDYVVKNIIALSQTQSHPKNRWYDKHELIAKAFEYLKEVPKDVQKSISQDVLDYLKPTA